MADVEIRAASLPGFPYYFPYRTGVRLQATPTAEIQKVLDNTSNVAAVTAVSAELRRTTFFAGPNTGITAAIIAGAQVMAAASAGLVVETSADASPPGPTGNAFLVARATLEIQALPGYSEIDREVFAEADLVAQLLTLPTLELNRTLAALLAVRAGLPATMLYNREGGNPLWLTFFYAGRGLYPVPDSGSAEE